MRMIRYSCCIISSGARLILWVLCYPWKPIRMSIPPSLSLYPSLFIRVCGLHKILFGSIPFHFALWNRHTFIIVAITFHLKWANATKCSALQREKKLKRTREMVWNSPSNPFIIHLFAFAFVFAFGTAPSSASTFQKMKASWDVIAKESSCEGFNGWLYIFHRVGHLYLFGNIHIITEL